MSSALALRRVTPGTFRFTPAGIRLARPNAVSAVITADGRRFVHSANPNSHLPFDITNRRAFAIKYFSYLGLGFAIPFVAIWVGWNKPGGLNNP